MLSHRVVNQLKDIRRQIKKVKFIDFGYQALNDLDESRKKIGKPAVGLG